jgi:hypothetical protein
MQVMTKRRTKKESDDLFQRIYLDKKAGKLTFFTMKALAEKYGVTQVTMKDWLEKMDEGLDRCGNKIYVSKKGIRYQRAEKSFGVTQLSQFDVPSDWVSVCIATYKYLDGRPSIRDRYKKLSTGAKVVLWKLIDSELSKLDADTFDYPVCSIPGEIASASIRIKISPGSEAKWRNLGVKGVNSKSRWVLNNVIDPFLNLFD